MSTEIATIPSVQSEVALQPESMLNPAMREAAALLAKSTMIPDSFKNNSANCIIALDFAFRLNLSPVTVMQNLYFVNNRPSWSGQFLIACINRSGLFSTPLRFEFSGEENTDDYGCVAYATDKYGETLKSTRITIEMAKKEGWWSKTCKTTKKEISKWQSMPQQMFQYRAAAFFARIHCPEITMGLLTQDEAIDIQATSVPLTQFVVSEVQGEALDIQTAPSSVAFIPATQEKVLEVEAVPLATQGDPPHNPMWNGSADFPPPEYDRQAEIANVKRLVDRGYFTKNDITEALKFYECDRISNLSDGAFESFVLGHVRLVEQIIDEITKRNIPRAKLSEFATHDNEHSFFVSSIATKQKILSLIMDQNIPQQGN